MGDKAAAGLNKVFVTIKDTNKIAMAMVDQRLGAPAKNLTKQINDKLFQRFLTKRVHKYFTTALVAPFLLHPVAYAGTPGRLEQHTPAVQVFCWALREEQPAASASGAPRVGPAQM